MDTPRRLFTDTLAIGVITIYGYLLTFEFFAGRYGYFGAPNNFIDLSISNVVVALHTLAIFLFVAVLGIEALLASLKVNIRSSGGKALVVSVLCVVFLIVAMLADTTPSSPELFLFLILILVLIMVFLAPLVIFRKESISYGEKLEKFISDGSGHNAASTSQTETALVYLRKKFGLSRLLGGISVVLLVVLVHALGIISARIQTKFTFISGEEPSVIIGNFHEGIITMSASGTKMLYAVMYPERLQNVVLSVREIGPISCDKGQCNMQILTRK